MFDFIYYIHSSFYYYFYFYSLLISYFLSLILIHHSFFISIISLIYILYHLYYLSIFCVLCTVYSVFCVMRYYYIYYCINYCIYSGISYSQALCDIIMRLLEVDEKKRETLSDIFHSPILQSQASRLLIPLPSEEDLHSIPIAYIPTYLYSHPSLVTNLSQLPVTASEHVIITGNLMSNERYAPGHVLIGPAFGTVCSPECFSLSSLVTYHRHPVTPALLHPTNSLSLSPTNLFLNRSLSTLLVGNYPIVSIYLSQ